MPVFVAACSGVTSSTGTQTVQLPKVSTSTFANSVSSWIGNTAFQISLANCTSTISNWEGNASNGGYQAHITWSFTAYGGNATLIANTGTSSVGAVAILKADGTPIRNDTDDVYTLITGTNTLTYYAAYYRTSTSVTPGTVSANATLTVTYQ
jgi:major type 1 subunit fimbrin (pilin)